MLKSCTSNGKLRSSKSSVNYAPSRRIYLPNSLPSLSFMITKSFPFAKISLSNDSTLLTLTGMKFGMYDGAQSLISALLMASIYDVTSSSDRYHMTLNSSLTTNDEDAGSIADTLIIQALTHGWVLWA